jgi:hypothetical protein
MPRGARFLVENLAAWVNDVEMRGLEELRRIPRHHDLPLLGDRKGQPCVRLSEELSQEDMMRKAGLTLRMDAAAKTG